MFKCYHYVQTFGSSKLSSESYQKLSDPLIMLLTAFDECDIPEPVDIRNVRNTLPNSVWMLV